MKAAKRRAEKPKEAQAILRKYACPVPYHEVRTRFLGNIASPDMSASPIRVVENLWGGSLPTFQTKAELEELFEVLVNGLWNALTRHQEPSYPFRLVRIRLEPTEANLGRLAEVRRQEADGFVEGLFNGLDEIDLPESAQKSMERLAEMRAMFGGAYDLVARGDAVGSPAEIRRTFDNLATLSGIMAEELNAVVRACTRARRDMIRAEATIPPTVH